MLNKKLPANTPLVLIILDGWGYREETQYNAIAAAHTPVWQQLWQHYPHTLITGSGLAVGLPKGQMGNSEVGHLHMGAGRLVFQDLTRIDLAVENGEFFKNPTLITSIDQAVQSEQALHVFGLLSPGGVHSHEQHIQALIKLAAERGAKKLYLHAFLDGRDTPPQSAKASLSEIEELLQKLGRGQIASITGRYYAMDRDKRWDRTQQAYDMLTLGQTKFQADSAITALEMAYERKETDEFVQPTLILDNNKTPAIINDGDTVIFMNFRADRARQLTRAFTGSNFTGFERKVWPQLANFVTLIEYAKDIAAKVAYPSQQLENLFGEYIAKKGYKQLRIAETEKYAHVTFFFNGGVETPFPGEDRILIPSPKVATYDLCPEMSAYELTENLVKAIKSQQYAVIICNFANPDMVGHSGNFYATVKAIETIDNCLSRITETLYETGGEALITSDHGNAEFMFDENSGQPHTAHTSNLVPVIYFGRSAVPSKEQGVLSDIAPTMLHLLELKQPKEMTGHTLFTLLNDER